MDKENNEEKHKKPTLLDAVQTIKFAELLPNQIMQMPCAASSLLLGFTTGASLGFARFYASRKVGSALNWAFFPFIVISSLSWEYCQLQRRTAQEQLSQMAAFQKQRDSD